MENNNKSIITLTQLVFILLVVSIFIIGVAYLACAIIVNQDQQKEKLEYHATLKSDSVSLYDETTETTNDEIK